MTATSREDISGHPDFPKEKEHLAATIEAMRQSIPELENAGYEINAWDSEVDINAKRMVAKYRQKKADSLRGALGAPYFGRVDFVEDDIYLPETLYIGRAGFNGPEEVQVVDWRAPKATVFYESQGGRAAYTVRDQKYYGEVNLKRQYQIDQGILEKFFDDQVLSTLTAGLPGEQDTDEVLLRRLQQGTDKLKDIVETIRGEQNVIIRQPLEQVTIVQGCAGSGKSTIALHRVSYLLYNYDNLQAAKVGIIAPNRLFLDYISAVLPGLELEEIRQFTFEDLCHNVLGWQPQPVSHQAGEQCEKADATGRQAAQYKGTLAFKQVLDEYVQGQTNLFCNKLEDISLYQGKLIITRKELVKKFTEGNNPYNRRVASLLKYMEFRLNYFLETSDSPLEQEANRKSGAKGYSQRIREYYEQKIYRSSGKTASAAKAGLVQELRQQLKDELEHLIREKDACLQQLAQNWTNLEVTSVYREVSRKDTRETVRQEISRVISKETVQEKVQERAMPGPDTQLSRQDLAGLCYLSYLLDGFEGKYQHLVVDEAQDLSPLEFVVLKMLCRNSFTILGDLAQGITANWGLANWQVLVEKIFAKQQPQFFELKQSYRSTREIVEFANRVIPPGLPRGNPVYRRGEVPGLEQTAGWSETVRRCGEMIAAYRAKGCETIAVISKEAVESSRVYQDLRKQLPDTADLHLITAETVVYKGGISVVPIALAKGLEFDAVIVWDTSAEVFTTTPIDAKLLFVALSRPLHYLHLFYSGRLTKLLQE